MENMQYICAKCGNYEYESDQFQATGGNFAKIFDIQNKKFITVSCKNVVIQNYINPCHRMDGIY